MKKQLFTLLALPVLVVSCTTRTRQTQVGLYEFLENVQVPEKCKIPKTAVRKYVHDDKSVNMEAAGISTDGEHHNEDVYNYFFNSDGSYVTDPTPAPAFDNPSQLNNAKIDQALSYYDDSSWEVRYYINPLKLSYYCSTYTTDTNYATLSFMLLEYTYDSNMWLTKQVEKVHTEYYVYATKITATFDSLNTFDFNYKY